MNKTNRQIQVPERGQVIVLLLVTLIGLIAMSGLIIDGGNLYLNRRGAQTAADAAALAAAREYCYNHLNLIQTNAIAHDYAVDQNHASILLDMDGNSGNSTQIVIDADNREITVGVETTTPSFFAKIFGSANESVQALASARCFNPGGAEFLLPIAWSCRPPVGGTLNTCTLSEIPYSVFDVIDNTFDFRTYLLDVGDGVTAASYQTDLAHTAGEGKLIYIVMDDDKFDQNLDCEELNPAGTINCDLDDDGVIDVEGGANRGWLLLDGNGASDLSDLIRYGYPNVISVNTWFPGKSGVSASVFDAAQARVGDIAILPIFNAICPNTVNPLEDPACAAEVMVGDTVANDGNKRTFYRVAAFAPFYISCVSKTNLDYCPGKDFAGIKHNTSTIEGYFLYGYLGGLKPTPGGFDLGVYIISLTN